MAKNRTPEKREEVKKFAQKLAAERAARSDTEQLKLLESRGHGHCKEAHRLRERING